MTNINDNAVSLSIMTNGPAPELGGKIVEIAITDGHRTWTTVVNPEDSKELPADTTLHKDDIKTAPVFKEIIGDIAAQTNGKVVTVHNTRAAIPFLKAELAEAGETTKITNLCTLKAGEALGVLVSRNLDYTCEQLGINHNTKTSSAAAETTWRLYKQIQEIAKSKGKTSVTALGGEDWGTDPWSSKTPTGKHQRRTKQAEKKENLWLFELSQRVEHMSTQEADLESYLGLLDKIMADDIIDSIEREELNKLFKNWGLTKDKIQHAHKIYVDHLIDEALDDHLLTSAEQGKLMSVSAVLGIPRQDLFARLKEKEKSLTK